MPNDNTEYEIKTIGLFDENKVEISTEKYQRQRIVLVHGKKCITNSNHIQFKKHTGDTICVHNVGLFDKNGKLITMGATEEIYCTPDGTSLHINSGWVEVIK